MTVMDGSEKTAIMRALDVDPDDLPRDFQALRSGVADACLRHQLSLAEELSSAGCSLSDARELAARVAVGTVQPSLPEFDGGLTRRRAVVVRVAYYAYAYLALPNHLTRSWSHDILCTVRDASRIRVVLAFSPAGLLCVKSRRESESSEDWAYTVRLTTPEAEPQSIPLVSGEGQLSEDEIREMLEVRMDEICRAAATAERGREHN